MKRGADLYRHRYTQGRRPRDIGGKGWSDMSTREGTPRIAGSHWKLVEARRDPPPGL